MYDEFFAKAHELGGSGEPFATAVVVRAERPTSGKPGDKAIVTADGVMFGWIGGSCAQPTVIAEALAAIADGESRLVRITPEPGEGPPREGLKEVAMTCFSGGTLDIYIEPQQPRPRLLVVGHLPVAQALVHLGRAMSYHTVAVDPETGGTGLAHADEVLTDLNALAGRVHPLTFVVVATHGNYDEPALEAALEAGARYVGLVASRKRAAPILAHLEAQGFGEEALAALHAPAGLDLGARRGDEIALSIVAEIVQIRRRAEGLAWPRAAEEGEEVPGKEEAAGIAAGSCCGGGAEATEGEPAQAAPATAVDPICGMSVKVEGARHTFEHGGEVYYFCCAGCRTKFAGDPQRYLAA